MVAGRLVVAISLLGACLFFAIRSPLPSDAFVNFLFTLTALTFCFSLLQLAWIPRVHNPRFLGSIQIAIDLLFITALASLTGGIASGFTFLFGICVVAAALSLGAQAAYLTAAAAAALCASMFIAIPALDAISALDVFSARHDISQNELIFALGLNLLGLCAIGALSGTLASRLQSTGGALKRAAARVANLYRLNEDILRSMSSGVITTDSDEQILIMNPAASAMLRIDEREAQGRNIADFFPHSADADDATVLAATRSEILAARADASPFQAGYSKTPLTNIEGQQVGYVIVFRDITEINELKMNAQRAERLSVLGRITASLAHEIRNPLSSISGAVQLVAESERLSEEDRNLLNIVHTEVERLAELLSTMLEIGKPRSPELRTTDLKQLIHDVVAVAQRGLAPNQHMQIHVDLPVESMTARVDSAQCRQVLWNLLRNALQVSPPGGMVEVKLYSTANNTLLEVSDRGPGVDETHKERLFELFFSGRSNGTGLGLTLVRQIMQAHEGYLDFSNREGGGAVFRAVFPKHS